MSSNISTGLLFTTVWRTNVNGMLVTKWYEGAECRVSDLMRVTEHRAFLAPKHIEAKTCEEAEANLLELLGPTHGTDWGCIYSEKQQGWFRPQCHIIRPPVTTAAEAVANMWGTTGGVFLILFIAAMCSFIIWWVVGCARLNQITWFWKIPRKLSVGRVTYKRQRSTLPMEDSMTENDAAGPSSFGVTDDSDEEEKDVYLHH